MDGENNGSKAYEQIDDLGVFPYFWKHQFLGGVFNYFFIFTPILVEIIQFDEHIFQMGWFNHQPDLLFQNLFSLKTLALSRSTSWIRSVEWTVTTSFFIGSAGVGEVYVMIPLMEEIRQTTWDVEKTSLKMGWTTYQLVQDFFHQQHDV